MFCSGMSPIHSGESGSNGRRTVRKLCFIDLNSKPALKTVYVFLAKFNQCLLINVWVVQGKRVKGQFYIFFLKLLGLKITICQIIFWFIDFKTHFGTFSNVLCCLANTHRYSVDNISDKVNLQIVSSENFCLKISYQNSWLLTNQFIH